MEYIISKEQSLFWQCFPLNLGTEYFSVGDGSEGEKPKNFFKKSHVKQQAWTLLALVGEKKSRKGIEENKYSEKSVQINPKVLPTKHKFGQDKKFTVPPSLNSKMDGP